MPNIETIIGQIYEASIAPSAIKEVMASICNSLDGVAAWWCVARPSAEDFYVVTDNVGCDPAMVEIYRREMWQQDYIINSSPPDCTIETRDILPDEQAFAQNDYARWLETSTSARYVICRSTKRWDGLLSGVGFLLPRGHEPDIVDRRLFDQLYPHIFRSFEIASRLQLSEDGQQDTLAILDSLSHAVVILDTRSQIIWANQQAYHIDRLNDGINLQHHTLRFSRQSDAQKVEAAIAKAKLQHFPVSREAVIAVGKPSGKRAYVVQIFAMPTAMQTVYGRYASAIVLIHDPDATPQKMPDLWQQLFGLTPTQAIMADYLKVGLTLDQAADLMGIARSTAASHLRAIFQKTDCSRQSELIRLLTSIPLVC